MSDAADHTTPAKETPAKPAEYRPPEGAQVYGAWQAPGGASLPYVSRAEWFLLREKEKPVAEIFSVAYVAEETAGRPVTFVFNGGPGAASAYLHVGALGTRRVAFAADGNVLPPPTRLTDNAESWLGFTDLVFVDPVGTGFSRVIEEGAGDGAKDKPGAGADPAKKRDPKAFFGLKRDLQSLGEFMSRWLSRHDRWDSPVFIAGESYGGFRVAKLSRLLHEGFGIGLNGAILISPALEFALLDSSDYDVLPWVDRFPTMAAAAAFHGRSRAFKAGTPVARVLAAAETFATTDLATFLAQGDAMPKARRARVLDRAAALLGLPPERVARAAGRVDLYSFVRELLRDEGRVCGLYDATITARDPFPDRDSYAGPDATLSGIERVFTSGINKRLRGEIGVKSEREYHLISYEVNKAWKIDFERHALDSQIGATDDLRYGLSLNPHMKVFLTHGLYDLVTPYYASNRIANLMKLDPATAARLTVRHFGGGHMFYAWERSRAEFRDAMAKFFTASLPKA
ncbi:MAG: peptidase S10 [Opitutaceae bacterium]|nr:peptidase S10 [Opitutaceae bacterium]